jgi:HEAT repeat protein
MPIVRTSSAFEAKAEPAANLADNLADKLAAKLARLAAPLPAERRAAAQALATEPQAVGALLGLLPGEPAVAVRTAVLAALVEIGTGAAQAGLAECLRSEDAWLRNAAIHALRAAPEQAAPLAQRLLADPERDVRILAVGILDAVRDPAVEAWLIELIERDDDVNVCGAALDLLAEVASLAAAEPVARLLARWPDEPYIRFAAQLLQRRIAGA